MKILNTKDNVTSRITAFIYGKSGIGKTSLASTLEGKTLIISTEAGLLSLAGRDIDFVEVLGTSPWNKMQSLGECIKMVLNQDVNYDNIFIDSLTEISQVIIEYEFEQINNDRSKSIVAWGEYSKKITNLIKKLRDMNKFNIIITALEKTVVDDLSRRFILPDLSGSIAARIPQYFDIVLHYDSVSMDSKEDKRFLLTTSTENVTAKDRSGKLDKFEKPNLKDIFNKIKGIK